MRTVAFSLVVACVYAEGPAAMSAPGNLHTGMRAGVRKLDAESLQKAVTRHRRFVVLMHDGADEETRAFQPWLYAIANLVPHLPIGTLDLSKGRGSEVAETFAVEAGQLPRVKLFVRDNPKGKRIVDYLGPLDFDAMLGWVQAAINDKDHELSGAGVEPPEVGRAGAGSGGGGSPAMNQLPEAVRKMAQTMVRETRLRRVLGQNGPDRVQYYDAMVSAKYRELVESEGTDLGDKFAVQEANRRVRDAVREELLVTAPLHIREEVEADVSLGDAANSMAPAGGGGGDGASPKKKKRPKKSGTKQEL